MNWTQARTLLKKTDESESAVTEWARKIRARAFTGERVPTNTRERGRFGILFDAKLNPASALARFQSSSSRKSPRLGEVYELLEESPSGSWLKVRFSSRHDIAWIRSDNHVALTPGEFRLLSSSRELSIRYVTSLSQAGLAPLCAGE